MAYHDVPDADAFRRQLLALTADYHPVDEPAVVEAASGGRPLPPRSLWFTFDDGYPGVVDRGQAVLDELGIKAALYVCPAFVDTDQPPWWEVVDEARRLGVGPTQPVVELKRMADRERRAVVERLAAGIEATTGRAFRRPQLSAAALRRWLTAGHSVGNHSWDHPCLDTCSDEEQARQVSLTHDWLVGELGVERPTFAYPNGNLSLGAESALRRLGYPLALLFDHRLSDLGADPLRVSRLRLSADASAERARAIVSGAHPLAFGAVQRLRSRR